MASDISIHTFSIFQFPLECRQNVHGKADNCGQKNKTVMQGWFYGCEDIKLYFFVLPIFRQARPDLFRESNDFMDTT